MGDRNVTDTDFAIMCYRATAKLRALAPKDTGNLAYNGVRLVFVSKKEALLYIDETVAPYMPYTNEPWLSPRWNGKKNPNEGWFDRSAEAIAEMMKDMTKGVMKRVDT